MKRPDRPVRRRLPFCDAASTSSSTTTAGRVRFAALQSAAGQRLLPEVRPAARELRHASWWSRATFTLRSTAALRIARYLDPPWPIFAPCCSCRRSCATRRYDLSRPTAIAGSAASTPAAFRRRRCAGASSTEAAGQGHPRQHRPGVLTGIYILSGGCQPWCSCPGRGDPRWTTGTGLPAGPCVTRDRESPRRHGLCPSILST